MAKQLHLYQKPLKALSDRLDRLVEGRLWLKVLIGLGLGILTGFLLGPELGLFEQKTSRIVTAWLALPGQVFLALIQMIVVPLVLASVVRGIASNTNMSAMRRIGLMAIVFILTTTIFGAITGIGLGQIIEPGQHIKSTELLESADSIASTPLPVASFPAAEDMPEKVVSLFPKNPIASMVSGEMLQVILFALILGFALISINPKQAEPLFDLLGALQEVSMRVVSWAMVIAPFAVFGLITRLVASMGLEVLAGMAMYVITVILGLLVLASLYLLIIRLLSNIELRTFLTRGRELFLLAFSTSSSAAVMPLSLKVVENDFKVRPEIARFLIPLGATINMTGTALYQGVATVFLAQVFQVDLTFSSYVFVVTMAIAASVGSPATPGAGIIILSVILEGVGIPGAGVALLLGVDRILDMSRTSINVMGDVALCCFVENVLPEQADNPETLQASSETAQ